jgi:hypothetical protein
MGRRLTAYVYVTDPDGLAVGIAPGEDVPDWAAEQITRPELWATPELEDGDGPPPLHGKGSGTAAWIAYARRLGFEVADDVDRQDVIDAVTAHLDGNNDD